ncbi:F-box/LRR-repeat protein At3g26922-like [Lolium perenne]|uniref:F-box/LRR-repeat protein At3g26922-like n=1 Tax=Lolium perenne TaxID=4522 RepID=UPI0021F52253|nr:uncharacterized protein LOC127303289 [Lolium perenne]
MATRRRHRRQNQPPGNIPRNWAAAADAPRAKRRKTSPCQRQEDKVYAGPSLPEDIWCHIHSLLPLRDAARTACVSHAFRWSWRRLPNLSFSKDSLGLGRETHRKKGISKDFTKKVDRILKKHSGTGIKTLEFRMAPHYKARNHGRLDRWLQMAATPGIEKVTLFLSSKDGTYGFPCSLLSDGKGDSIRHLELANCFFCPTTGPWSLRNLTVLDLSFVHATGEGLWCLLSTSSALERFSLRYCSGIICLSIPGSLQRLEFLKVDGCDDLQAVKSKAPNLSRFNFGGNHRRTHISLGEALRVKELYMDCSSYACCSRAELVPSGTLDAETVIVHPITKTMDTPARISSKSTHLERLYIQGIGITPFYLSVKYCALFGGSHSVEDFTSYVSNQLVDHVSFYSMFPGGETSGLPMKEVSQVEGACHMLKSWLS